MWPDLGQRRPLSLKQEKTSWVYGGRILTRPGGGGGGEVLAALQANFRLTNFGDPTRKENREREDSMKLQSLKYFIGQSPA